MKSPREIAEEIIKMTWTNIDRFERLREGEKTTHGRMFTEDLIRHTEKALIAYGNERIENSSKAAKDFLEDYSQGICEEFNMGDISQEDLLLKLRMHEKMMERLLAKIDALKTKKAGESK